MKTIKKISALIITLSVLCGIITPCDSQAAEVSTDITYLSDGSYIETTIITYPETRSTGSKTATKTATYKNADDEPLWSVAVTGTFSYETGKNCICIGTSGESKSYNSVWKVSGATATKSKNTASATATGTKYFVGVAMHSYDLTVTLTCDTYGNLS